MSESPQQHAPVSTKERRLFILLIIVGLSLCGFFGFRAVRSYIRLQRMGLTSGTSEIDAIRGWMTIPYIAAAYGVPEEHIFKEIGIPVEGNLKKNLSQINLQHAFGEKGLIVEAVKAAITKYHETSSSRPETDHE